ncbi:unnamed protein product [Durusdinium trenchii]|uniref:Uncharacterized protein n=1 Tax=Durusdinium trenchii TaxID=1381693 RepID=A0ABP0LH34_9DINO
MTAERCRLLHLRPHVAYHIVCTEDVTEIEDRFAWSGDMVEGNIILLSQEDLLQQMRFLRDGSESREADDAASTGLSQVFKEARERGLLAACPKWTCHQHTVLVLSDKFVPIHY